MAFLPFALSVAGALLLSSLASADELDEFVLSQMQRRQIPGASLCIFDGGKIVKAKGYGVVENGHAAPVTPDTLFQAASLGKPVTATAALVLVEQKRLSLDDDVNTKLTSWKIPDSEFTRQSKVTLRALLSRSGGMSGAFFAGYDVDDALPSLVQVLDGLPPAKSKPIRVESVPGVKWNYSGGGYLVVQQLLVDVTGRPFPDLMQASVFAPLGMTSSTFQQPLPAGIAARTAAGYRDDRAPVHGRSHVYPEMAAAGLWSTACDLARFAIGMQHSLAGAPSGVLAQPMARQMVTRQKLDSGLGFFIDGKGVTERFLHQGRDEGFDSLLMAYVETGKGAVMMMNANDDSRFVPRVLRRIAELYEWPDFPRPVHRDGLAAMAVDAGTLARYEGRYQLSPDQTLVLAARKGRLFTQSAGLDDEEFLPITDKRFVSAERDAEVIFEPAADGSAPRLIWKNNGKEAIATRASP